MAAPRIWGSRDILAPGIPAKDVHATPGRRPCRHIAGRTKLHEARAPAGPSHGSDVHRDAVVLEPQLGGVVPEG